MESRKVFEERICDYFPKNFVIQKKFFEVNPSVRDKVDENNHFKGFWGDTLVFDLKDEYKFKLNSFISRLYEVVPECFCAKLSQESLHLTLHDLSSANICREVTEDVMKNESNIKELLKVIKILPTTIRMKTYCLANILNISLVLVFIPADDVEYLKLMTVYHLFDVIRILGYKYSPHVTLGYFNVNGFDVTAVTRLENLVNELNKESFEMSISTEDLFYQHFTSMNDYQNIFKFT